VKPFALLFLAAPIGFSQWFSFGVKAGVPVTDFGVAHPDATNTYLVTSTTNPYVVGGTFEAHLPRNFAAEFDALYRHFRFQDQYLSNPMTLTNERVSTGLLEFPLLLKYRLHGKVIRPFVDGGASFDRLIGLTDSFVNRSTLPYPPESGTSSTTGALLNTTVPGFAVGGGVDVHVGFLHLSPELRYTRWESPHLFKSNQNQAELLLGITY